MLKHNLPHLGTVKTELLSVLMLKHDLPHLDIFSVSSWPLYGHFFYFFYFPFRDVCFSVVVHCLKLLRWVNFWWCFCLWYLFAITVWNTVWHFHWNNVVRYNVLDFVCQCCNLLFCLCLCSYFWCTCYWPCPSIVWLIPDLVLLRFINPWLSCQV